MTTDQRVPPALEGGLGSDTGAAHRHLYGHRLQLVLLTIGTEFFSEEHSALLDGHRVVVVGLCEELLVLGGVRDQDAPRTQTLGLSVAGREVVP